MSAIVISKPTRGPLTWVTFYFIADMPMRWALSQLSNESVIWYPSIQIKILYKFKRDHYWGPSFQQIKRIEAGTPMPKQSHNIHKKTSSFFWTRLKIYDFPMWRVPTPGFRYIQ